eukprot:CAMPEP_0172517436 /NCGR_PEP_ID=MMETSP1066-20121228/284995_1 /TAXON_ID=671091 /ORGANISM="Coscinodiscus wailesii, Strain CCMP2513" /LENGTH=239 /DNA_ID=CAMNT_0013299435 /DNA_START=119 /DNA_END=834 /DNA_ORIENTATION=-
MKRSPKNQRQNKKSGKKRSDTTSAAPFKFKRKQKLEIKFDPEARKEYLTGFSKRKRERRLFGLAMQKVKDRKAKVDERKELKKAFEEQAQDIERNKRDMEEAQRRYDDDDGAREDDQKEEEEEGNDGNAVTTTASRHDDKPRTMVEHYRTDVQFGGSVTVTTTFGLPDAESDEERDLAALQSRKKDGGVDDEQRYAGSAARFMKELKANMPAKAKKGKGKGSSAKGRSGGQHGAAGMKG